MFAQLLAKFRPTANRDCARTCYAAISQQSRLPIFYQKTGLALPDNRNTRFELLLLHLFLVLHARRTMLEERDFTQSLFDTAFTDLDYALREMGVGDLSVGKKVQRMAEIFYGRITQYGAVANDSSAMIVVLQENITGLQPHGAAVLSVYIQASLERLSKQGVNDIQAGALQFAPVGN